MQFYDAAPDAIQKLFQAPPHADRVAILLASALANDTTMFYLQLELLAEDDLYDEMVRREDYDSQDEDEEMYYQRKKNKQTRILQDIHKQFRDANLIAKCKATLFANTQNVHYELRILERRNSDNFAKAAMLVSMLGHASFVSGSQAKRFEKSKDL